MEDATNHQTGNGCSSDYLAELVERVELEGLGLLLLPGNWSLNLCSLNSVLLFVLAWFPFLPFLCISVSFSHPASSGVLNPPIDPISIFAALIKTRRLVILFSVLSLSHTGGGTLL